MVKYIGEHNAQNKIDGRGVKISYGVFDFGFFENGSHAMGIKLIVCPGNGFGFSRAVHKDANGQTFWKPMDAYAESKKQKVTM